MKRNAMTDSPYYIYQHVYPLIPPLAHMQEDDGLDGDFSDIKLDEEETHAAPAEAAGAAPAAGADTSEVSSKTQPNLNIITWI